MKDLKSNISIVQAMMRGRTTTSKHFDMQGNDATFWPIPNIGDHVSIEGIGFGKGEGGSICVVESRTFFYAGSANDPFCAINIVLTDSKTDPRRLIKS